jgi:hypothetical protein
MLNDQKKVTDGAARIEDVVPVGSKDMGLAWWMLLRVLILGPVWLHEVKV